MTRTGIPKIAVLMSSYNGEKYICEQIESILNQKGVDVTLFVRDDCSADATPSILEYYEREDRIVYIRGEENLRPASSFMSLFYEVYGSNAFDYFSFSDQDDIWLPDKLDRAVEMIKIVRGPALYCSNQTVFSEGENDRLRYDEVPNLSLVSVLFENQLSGCTMVFNDALAAELYEDAHRPSQDILDLRMHDTWVLLVAYAIGKVVYDPESRILYRIHAENQVGVANDRRGAFATVGAAVKFFFQGSMSRYRSVYASELLRCFPDMSSELSRPLSLIADYQNSAHERIALLFNQKIRRESKESALSYMVKVGLGAI